eukprot:CAMPEP_0194073708 /NCGR_PEP_ID=MMETSP0149-20130528/1017_1 /TAXON_ID=122233 /ORGANISM="Chaetoceros debilis, Strain MM31A-1" /LENGTH=644 /DNA_ID=CAMNT_0038753749 /DNA_START=70 /DNA_END=2004 /DNA_ORIENTATION=-
MDPPTEDDAKAKEATEKKTDPLDSDTVPDMPDSAPPPPPPPPTNVTEEETADVAKDDDKKDDDAVVEDSTTTEAEKDEAKEKKVDQPKESVAKSTDKVAATAEEEEDGPVSHDVRSKTFHELRSYEAKRRTIYTSKMKSTSIYWRSFRDLLSKSYQETDRAENLVRGTVVANKAYTEFLRASAEDRIDGNGMPVAEARGNRLKQERKKKYSSLGGGQMLMNLAMNNKIVEKVNGDSSIPDVQSSVSFENLPDDSLVSELVQCTADMADKFTENVNFIEDVALTKLCELKKELEAELSVMSVLGDATIYELEKAEEDVQKAWAAFYSLACLADSNALTQKANIKGIDPNAVTDVWLVEMHYRMAVAYLTTVWEKSSAELSTLFAGVKEMECNRRFRLRELMVLFMERGERLWESLPPLAKSVLEILTKAPTDTKKIEANITEIVREKARVLQRTDEANVTTDPLNGPGLAGVPEIRDDFELQSPLMSNLLIKTEVIWRKSDKIMSIWKPCLAATTSDGYLHLFELPSTSNIVTKTPAEVAFQALVPPVEVPTEDAIVEGGFVPMSMMGKSWFENLIPGVSFQLKNCNISLSQQKGNSTFEISEVLPPTGLSKLSKNVRRRKYSLRLSSSQEMVDWLLCIRSLGAE